MSQTNGFLDEFTAEKPESFREEVFVPRRGRWKRLLALPAALAAFACIWLAYLAVTASVLPDMTGWQLDAIRSWVDKHHPTATLAEQYSDTVDKGLFLGSEPQAGTRLARSAPLRIRHSGGADPSQPVSVPELKGMTVDRVQSWIRDNKLSGATVSYEPNELVAKDTVIQVELLDGTADQFLRKSRIRILVSTGAAGSDQTFAMPDLTGKSRQEALRWATEKGVRLEVETVFDSVYATDVVMRQSIRKDTKITRNDALSLAVSRGPALKVPDFKGLTRQEASDLASLSGIKVFFRHKESSGTADTVLSQDMEPGVEIDGKTVVTVVVAAKSDQLVVPDFTGLTGAEAEKLASLSELKVFVLRNGNNAEKAVIRTQSVKAGKAVRRDQLILLSLDPGTAATMPDFKGMNRQDASVVAQNMGLSPVFSEVRSTQAANGTVLRQDAAPGTPVGDRKSLLLEVAVNSGVIAVDLTTGTRTGAEAWAADNGLTLRLVERYHDSLPAGALFGQEGIGRIVPAGGSVTVQVSLGRPLVPDFTGKPKTEVIAWQREANAKGAGITAVFTDDAASTQPVGCVSTQNVRADYVPLNASITFGVSTRENTGVRIPSLTGMNIADARSWCAANGVTCSTEERYADERANQVIGQSHAGGYLGKGDYLRLVVSLGRPVMPDLSGKDAAAARLWLEDVNRQGANLKLAVGEDWSETIVAGKVLRQPLAGSEVVIGSTVTVTLSKGPAPQQP